MRRQPLFSVAMVVPCLALVSLVTSGASCGGDDTEGVTTTDDSGAGDGSKTDPRRDSGGSGNQSDGGGSGDDAGGKDGGDSGPVCESFPVGDPVTGATANAWTWIPVAGAKCRNGSDTGFAIRLKPGSKKLMIYLQGGGACFNGTTCGVNPSSFDFAGWNGTQSGAGILSDTNAANPVKDWNAVFFPYCSGDIFGGSLESGNVPSGPSNQRFTGVPNVIAYLKRIVPTFTDVDQVLLTGSSAGGFGAAVNYDRVATAFCPRPVALIDDAGPVMSDTYLPPCLQKRFRDVWNLNAGLPSGCTACNLQDGGASGGLVNALPYVINKWPQGRFGLLSADQDSTIRLFMSFGNDNCGGIDGLPPAAGYPGAQFSKGLAELRETYLKPTGRASTYYVSGSTHTFLYGDGFYNTTVQNVPLTDWVKGVVEGAAPSQIGP